MAIQKSPLSEISYRTAGRAAIASGITGVIVVGLLIAYLVVRSTNLDEGLFIGKLHDGVAIIQFLLMIPVVFALHRLWRQRVPGDSKGLLNLGIASILFTALFLFLDLLKIIADVLYMFPQGIFGVWIMIMCWRMKGILHNGLRWFGMVVGFGLALVGIFPLEYAIFVDKIMLNIPAATDEAVEHVHINNANMIVHQILWIGSPLGVLTLPFWTILVGRRLFREGVQESSVLLR